MRGDEATADVIVVWCLCCCGLCLYARTHNVCLLWEEEGYTLRGTAAGYTGRDLATLSQRQRRLQQTNATSRIIQRGYTAPPALCAGPPSAASIAPASELQKRSRSVSRAPLLSAKNVTRLPRDLVACPTNHRLLSLSNPEVTRI